MHGRLPACLSSRNSGKLVNRTGGSFMERQNSLLGILAGIGTGAGAMYFLDPDRGARRRAIATDKLASSVKGIPRAVRVTRQDIANRAHGTWAETQHLFAKNDASDDV